MKSVVIELEARFACSTEGKTSFFAMTKKQNLKANTIAKNKLFPAMYYSNIASKY